MITIDKANGKLVLNGTNSEQQHLILTHKPESDFCPVCISKNFEISRTREIIKNIIPKGSSRKNGTWFPEIIIFKAWDRHYGVAFNWVLPESITQNSGRTGIIYLHAAILHSYQVTDVLALRLAELAILLLRLYSNISNPFFDNYEELWNGNVADIREGILNSINSSGLVFSNLLTERFNLAEKEFLSDSFNLQDMYSFFRKNTANLRQQYSNNFEVDKINDISLFYELALLFCRQKK